MTLVYAGQLITPEDINSLDPVVDAVNLTTNPVIATAAFASETNVPSMQLSASVVAGAMYLIFGQLTYSMTNTDTETNLRFRRDTAVTGTLLGSVRLGRPPFAGFGEQVAWSIPWVAASTGAVSVYCSILRGAGTGNTTLEGGTSAFVGMRLIDPAGTLRTA